MLRTYASPNVRHEALENLCSIRQIVEEEGSYKKLLSDAIKRCVNVNEEDEKMNFYIDRLSHTTRNIVDRLREGKSTREEARRSHALCKSRR